MSENIQDFIDFHNANISNLDMAANLETISLFASEKNIALDNLSIEKHRLPFITWITSLSRTPVDNS